VQTFKFISPTDHDNPGQGPSTVTVPLRLAVRPRPARWLSLRLSLSLSLRSCLVAAWHWPMGPSLSHGTVTSSILLTGRLLVVLVAWVRARAEAQSSGDWVRAGPLTVSPTRSHSLAGSGRAGSQAGPYSTRNARPGHCQASWPRVHWLGPAAGSGQAAAASLSATVTGRAWVLGVWAAPATGTGSPPAEPAAWLTEVCEHWAQSRVEPPRRDPGPPRRADRWRAVSKPAIRISANPAILSRLLSR